MVAFPSYLRLYTQKACNLVQSLWYDAHIRGTCKNKWHEYDDAVEKSATSTLKPLVF